MTHANNHRIYHIALCVYNTLIYNRFLKYIKFIPILAQNLHC